MSSSGICLLSDLLVHPLLIGKPPGLSLYLGGLSGRCVCAIQPVFPLAMRHWSSVYALLLEVEGLSPAWVLTGFGDPIGHEQS